jgi:hypothetical protein
MISGYVTPAVAREIFGDRRVILTWGSSPDGRAVTVDGGYRVSGTFTFASGCRQATWLGGQCESTSPMALREDGRTVLRRRAGCCSRPRV